MRDVFFDYSNPYDTGTRPRVAMANGIVVEVHQSQSSDTLWWHVGTVTGGLVGFGDSVEWDDGITPSVAVNAAGVVVEVHETQSFFSSGMFCRVGRVNAAERSITFGPSDNYDSGDLPDVALNDQNTVIEVHESNGLSTNLWCRVGRVYPEREGIRFGDSVNYDSGLTPSVALNNHNVAVEVHRAEGLSTALWYRVGIVDPATLTVDFGESVEYEDGADPSVALTDDGFVIEVHRSQTYDTLWKRVGRVNAAARRIEWLGDSVQYGAGGMPAVATDGVTAVEVHQDGGALYSAASLVMDRTSWMRDRLALLGGQPLRKVVMPASHDAGMSTTRDCRGGSPCSTRTQTLSILGQLRAGSRYFDLRPVHYGGVIYTGHYNTDWTLGCNGQTLAEVLDDVNTYFRTGSDLVILKFSHYFDRDGGGGFSDGQMEQLLEQVTSALKPLLYCRHPQERLSNVTVGDYLANGGAVLAVFDKLSGTLHDEYPCAYYYADAPAAGDLVVYDEYADTNDLDGMISDQLGKLAAPGNHGDGRLFLLSWTLTQSTEQAIGCVAGLPSILDLARQANTELWPRLVQAYRQGGITPALVPNLVYVDNLQGGATDFAVWLNQQLLGQASPTA